MTGDRFFRDDPIDGTTDAPDLLSREQYAEQLVELLGAVRRQSSSSVLALIGSWGSGKSSVLNMAIKAARFNANNWLIAEYNPWMYSDLESLLAGFFGELRGVLPKDKRWNDVRRRIGDFGASISPLGKLGSLIGVDVSGIAKLTAQFIAGDVSSSVTKKKAEEALRAIDRPILMILDDLDRLTPQELLLVFKLIRLVGNLPNVYYLLCYDEKTLIDVLCRTDLAVGDRERAQDYLEKMVQIRLDLPALRSIQTGNLVDAGIDAVLKRHDITLTSDQVPRVAQAYHSYLKQHFNTPRAINRFFAQLSACYGTLHDEVDFVDFMFITFIRTTTPRLYELLFHWKEVLTGSGLQSFAERQLRGDQLAGVWRDRLKHAGIPEDEIKGAMDFLALMFVPIEAALGNSQVNTAKFIDLLRRRGVGHVDYFDRYFSFGIPEEDIADSTVIEGLRQLGAGEQGEALIQLTQRLVDDTARTVRKISVHRSVSSNLDEGLIALLADAYEQVPESLDMFIEDPGRSLVALGRDLFVESSSNVTADFVRRIGGSEKRLVYVARCVEAATHLDEDGGTNADWQEVAQEAVRDLIEERLGNVSDPLSQMADATFSLVWIWKRFDLPGLKIWIRGRIDSGDWPLIDVVSRFATVGRALGAGAGRTVMGDFSISDLDAVLGISYVLENLADEITATNSSVGAFASNPTMQDRRDFALNILKDFRSRMSD